MTSRALASPYGLTSTGRSQVRSLPPRSWTRLIFQIAFGRGRGSLRSHGGSRVDLDRFIDSLLFEAGFGAEYCPLIGCVSVSLGTDGTRGSVSLGLVHRGSIGPYIGRPESGENGVNSGQIDSVSAGLGPFDLGWEFDDEFSNG